MTYPSLFLDAYARFSAVDLPGLGTSSLGLRNPDPLVAIDGAELHCTLEETRAPLACVRTALDARRGDVQLTFEHDGQRVTVKRALAVLGAHELTLLFIVYAIVGLLVLWSGGMVLRHVQPSAGATAYAAWTLAASLFFFTFYDYHSTTWLAPVFSLATVGTEVAFLWLAFAFPTSLRSTLLRHLLVGLTAFAALAVVWMLLAPLFHHDPVTARNVVSLGALPALGALFVAMVARWRRAEATARAELRSAFLGLAVVPALIALGIALAATTGIDLIHAFLPLLGLIMPLSIGYALLRRNVLGAREVLGRVWFELPSFALSIAVFTVVWLEGDLVVATVVAVAVWFLLARVLAPRVFPARASFRPSIEALRDVLGERRRATEVADVLGSVIERWVGVTTARVQFPESNAPAAELDMRPDGITMPVRALGELRAILTIGPRRDGAPFNREDVALIETIAGFGGLALHHASVLEELDRLRRADLEAAGREKQATLGLVGAEVAHEVAYSLNYLRFLLRDNDKSALEADDIEVGRDEIARLERMLGALRRLAPPPPMLAPTALAQPLHRARSLVRELVDERRVEFSLEPAETIVLADRDQLVQVFANLFRNAIQAVPVGGEIAVRCGSDGGRATISIIDNGPGVPDELLERLFTPWATGRPGGTGLGLAVAARVVQGWNGSLRYKREANRTVFSVEVPEVTA